jgi:DNA topoisomerase-1
LSLRVGNREYADENGSFGATTLQRRHMRLADGQIRLSFVAKGCKRVRHSVSDKRLMAALEKARDLPGAELFGWIDADGAPHSITSSGVNAYLDNGENAGFTAKTFRTWSGTLAAFECVTAGRTTIAEMAQAAADRLGNTPGIARKSYIHPQVLDLAGRDYGVEAANRINGLSATEARLLAFLDRQG